MVRCGSKNKYQKDTCLKKVGLHAQKYDDHSRLRAWPPIPPNANGGRVTVQWAGHCGGAAPSQHASGDGQCPANPTRGDKWRNSL